MRGMLFVGEGWAPREALNAVKSLVSAAQALRENPVGRCHIRAYEALRKQCCPAGVVSCSWPATVHQCATDLTRYFGTLTSCPWRILYPNVPGVDDMRCNTSCLASGSERSCSGKNTPLTGLLSARCSR